MTANEIRKKFLDFFTARAHRIVPSDSLVPKDDPTVLFTTAGMQQFKRQFLGQVTDFRRAASSQKCLRTDDLEEVGRTPFHHTFFEMLGNFSFGDYFKSEAIPWAWEFLTVVIRIPAEKLWVSVYQDDIEAETIWLKDVGIPKERFVHLGDKSNFWPSEAKDKGPNGPCGPCSEIFYDYGVNPKCTKGRHCDPSCSCGRFSEIWNLVFTQFNRKEGGILEPLPAKNIDTGMGLERLTAVVQGKANNFDTDLFLPIRKVIKQELRRLNVSLPLTDELIIADHVRAIVFAIADGIIPSNKERGSVVKRLIVDSTNLVLRQGAGEPVIYKFVPAVMEVMREPYPEIERQRQSIEEMILRTEQAFLEVRRVRIPEVESKILKLKVSNHLEQELGHLIFVSQGTFGLPLISIVDTAKKLGISEKQNQEALKFYGQEMSRHQELSRKTSKMAGDVFIADDLALSVPETRFLGYEKTQNQAKVLKIFVGAEEVQSATVDDDVKIILDQTSFYAESGGQIGDQGEIVSENGEIQITDTKKIHNAVLHYGAVIKGTISRGETVTAKVDTAHRMDIMRNHTATHLLQAALRHVLGSHVQQQGSLVTHEYLRFDFSHPQQLTDEQIRRVEDFVYERILDCDEIKKESMGLKQARDEGALAFFQEKYGDTVRVISIAPYSRELCGGTHLHFTGQIGLFKIISESSIAQGIRRIEAVTGWKAYCMIREQEKRLCKAGALLKSSDTEILPRIESQIRMIKELEKELAQFRFEGIKSSLDQTIAKSQKVIGGITLFAADFHDIEMDLLRRISDLLKEKIKSCVVVLGSKCAENAYLLAAVTDDLIEKGIQANDLIKVLAPIIKGSGGGRPQMAQAGSRDPQNIPRALEEAAAWIKTKTNKNLN